MYLLTHVTRFILYYFRSRKFCEQSLTKDVIIRIIIYYNNVSAHTGAIFKCYKLLVSYSYINKLLNKVIKMPND